MNKLYQFLLFFLILLLLILNLIFFSYGENFMAQFEGSRETKSSKEIISSLSDEDYSSDFFNLEILKDERFQNLKDFKVDLDDVSFIDDIFPSEPGEQDDPSPAPAPGPEFETGNPNPFRPQF